MLALPASLTIADANDALRALAQGASGAAGDAVTVDASALLRFDSAALAVLLELRRVAQRAGRPFAVLHAPARLADLARLYGVGGLLLAPASVSGAAPAAAHTPAAVAAR